MSVKAVDVADIAAFITAASTDELVTITGTVSIAYVNEYTTSDGAERSNVFLQDATGWIMMYSANHTGLTSGQALTGLQGKYKLNYGASQIIEAVIPTATSGPIVSPTLMTITSLTNDHINRYIMVKDVSIIERVEGKYTNKYAVDSDGNELWIYDKFKTNLEVIVGHTYDLVGILTSFNNKLELGFTNVTDKGSGIEELQLQGIEYNGQMILNPNGVEISLYSVSGQQLMNTTENMDLSELHSGVYILVTPKGILKIAK
ncbi:hypothetical protein N9251_01840 [Gammaproteobacteria bacterium]|nr:hypothetical protein [Gammaproteobacteria bacterium]